MADNPKSLRDIIKEEYKKCYQDPIYFMKKYVKIQHPLRGTINFELYDFQEKALSDLIKFDFNIILKSRQLGISTLTSAYSLWLMTFHNDKNILCISITQETAKEIVTKVRFANDNLPSWLKVPCVEDNRLSLRLKNGSQIKAVSSAGTAGRSASLSLLVIDECAFIDNVEEIWLSAQSTLSTGGKAILLSTPNGVGNLFHKTWIAAENKQNKFNPIRLPWTLHPDRDQTWRDQQTEVLGAKGAAQECDCEFSTTGNTVVEIATVEWYQKTKQVEPIEMRGLDKNVWIFEYPSYAKSYIICADVARGDGGDNSAFHVLDLITLKQVAEYQGKINTKDYGNLLVTIATEYNNALLVIENASIGWAAIQQIIDRKYQNLFYSSADLKYIDVEKQMANKINASEKKMVPGFTTTQKTRPLIVSNLEKYFRERSVDVCSSRLLNELSVFIWNGNKAEAMRGYHDDLVMSLAIGLWVRDTALRLRTEGLDLNRASIDGIKSTTNHSGMGDSIYIPNSNKGKTYWQMPVGKNGDQHQDLKWLL